jgi:hypothetical protein
MASRSERGAELRAALAELEARVAKVCAARSAAAARRRGASTSPANGAAGRARSAVPFRAPFAVPRDEPRSYGATRRVRGLLLRPVRALLAWWRR